MVEIKRKDASILRELYKDSQDSLVWSYFDDCFGRAWADSAVSPTCAMIMCFSFLYFGGDAGSVNAELLVRSIPLDEKEVIVVCPDKSWEKLFKSTWEGKFETWKRFAIKKEGDIFDRAKLQGYIDRLDKKYKIRRIDGELYRKCLEDEQFMYFVLGFDSEEDFLKRGIGFCAMLGDEIVGGCSSYSVYAKGIEIEVDTDEEYRNQGIAAACAATLILDCLERGLYPAWDAANMTSVRLAERLGYHFSHEYIVYAVDMNKAKEEN